MHRGRWGNFVCGSQMDGNRFGACVCGWLLSGVRLWCAEQSCAGSREGLLQLSHGNALRLGIHQLLICGDWMGARTGLYAAVTQGVIRSSNIVFPAFGAWTSVKVQSQRGIWGMPSPARIHGEWVRQRATGLASPKPLIVTTYQDGMSWQHMDTDASLKCPTLCWWSRDTPWWMADVVAFDCLQAPPKGIRPPPWQVWVFLCIESSIHLPHTRTEPFLKQFHLAASHHSSPAAPGLRHLQLSYAPGAPEMLFHPLDVSYKRKAAVWVVSNCAEARINIVRELQRYIEVDIFGKCNGRPMPSHGTVYGSEKVPLLQRYWMTIAFENAIEDDYITEKLFQPLIAGSIPVYFGTPAAEHILPAPSAAVLASKYGTVGALGTHLQAMLRDDGMLKDAVAWKSARGVPSPLQHLFDVAFNGGQVYGEKDMRQSPCRICQAASELTRR